MSSCGFTEFLTRIGAVGTATGVTGRSTGNIEFSAEFVKN